MELSKISPDYYMSEVVDPFGENSVSQEEVDENAFFIYQCNSIIESIGSKECSYQIDLFFNDVYSKLTDVSKIKFFKDCFTKLSQMYDLEVIHDDVTLFITLEQIEKYVLPLLFFFEKESSITMVALCFPYADISVLRNFELFKKFTELNYNDFLEKLKANDQYPFLVKQFFIFAALDVAILTLWKIISRDTIGINVQQLLKGERK